MAARMASLVGMASKASVLAEFSGLALGIWLVRRELSRVGGTLHRGNVLDPVKLRRILSVNGNLLVRTLSLMFVFAFITAQGARMGTAILAANAILLQFQYLMAYALDGFAHAAEALAGRAFGERNPWGFRKAVRLSLVWSAAVALLFALGYALAGPSLIHLLTGQPDLRELSASFLPWVVLSPLVSFWSFLLDGVFVGATWAREMRNTMVLAVLAGWLPPPDARAALSLRAGGGAAAAFPAGAWAVAGAGAFARWGSLRSAQRR